MSDLKKVEVVKEVQGKTVLSFSKPTPLWATWTFRIVFLLTTAATIIIAGETHIPDDVKTRIFLYMKGLDFVVWGIGRGLGINKTDVEK
ncbi:MAG: hypothetical protein KA954_12010 [Chitinophagales bacterium]|nr:hypothetical protein [Bacteroidota bacterium]MBP7400306.1 hypothetical protein [Chitinophagales bacterium]MBP8754170.1 hypothetical protein [Chitinophagales bacterium]MBP9704648.1 hypothetical protein [Chitinophagales bacterium]